MELLQVTPLDAPHGLDHAISTNTSRARALLLEERKRHSALWRIDGASILLCDFLGAANQAMLCVGSPEAGCEALQAH